MLGSKENSGEAENSIMGPIKRGLIFHSKENKSPDAGTDQFV
jgi:hypothetical protein